MAEAMLSSHHKRPPTVVSQITRVVNQHKVDSAFFDTREDFSRASPNPRYNSKDSGIGIDELSSSPKKVLYPAEPNLG